MNTSCEIINDLLPLYVDDICSEESRALVDEHIKECPDCTEMLEDLRDEMKLPVSELDDAKPIKAIQRAWKKDKTRSFIRGISITVVIVAAVAVLLIALYYPRPIIKAPYSMAYDIERKYSEDGGYGVNYKTIDDNYFLISRILYKGEDVTERFDPEELAKLLSNTMSRRKEKSFGARDMVWEITIGFGNRPIHINLGQTEAYTDRTMNYWYSFGTHYEIIDPTALTNALETMMKAEVSTAG